MRDPWQNVIDKLYGWGEAALELLPNIAVALIVLLGFVLLSKLARRAAQPALRRASSHRELHGLALAALRLGIIGAGVFVALGVMNLDGTVTSLLAGVGVIGIALGFAFQDIAANFMAGIILAVRQPFKDGDMVEIGDFSGTVLRLDLRATVGRTFQGQVVTIPNKDVLGSQIVNYDAGGEWRIEVAVGVSYGDDLELAEQAVREALEKVTERDESKELDVWFTGFGASSIDMSARVWIRAPEQSFLLCRSQIVKNIKASFDAHELTIPFPIRTLDFGIVGGKEISDALDPALERMGKAA
ncbi:MAG: mechanosensitive ion channel family protein [Deltaproteobacteria bacterium]|nr:mechanosensitive ion channel family protein [Deltaproteobacteria bacterium]